MLETCRGHSFLINGIERVSRWFHCIGYSVSCSIAKTGYYTALEAIGVRCVNCTDADVKEM
jgi:hypothetical protein